MTPFSLEAERGLLARLLIDPSQVTELHLDPNDLHDPDARAGLAAMQALAEQNERIDILTIRREAGRDINIDVLDLTPAHHAPLDAYAHVIRKDAWRRRFISRMEHLSLQAEAGYDPEALMEELRAKALEIEVDASAFMSDANPFHRLDLSEHRSPPPPPLLDALSWKGTTVIYGDGGDGKGWVVAKWASQMPMKVCILDFEMQPSEWAYRLDKFGIDPDQVIYISPPSTFEKWATDRAARYLVAENVGFLIVDSAMYASNADDPYSPAGALAYGRARRRLNNLPALLLAHTTGNQDKVFGSVFWRNESRIVWRLSKDITRTRHLECRKANNYQWLEGKKFTIEFNEEQGVLNLHEHGKPWKAEDPNDF